MLRTRQVVRCFSTSIKSASSSTNNTSSNTTDNDNDQIVTNKTNNNPLTRTLKTLRNDIAKATNFLNPKSYETKSEKQLEDVKRKKDDENFQEHCDVLIIGGGGVGSSVAYWLKRKARNGLNVVVVEKDPTFSRASTVLSVGGLRQQFSLMENIQMSLFGADFMRDSKKYLGDVDLCFTPYGYLILATDKGAEQLTQNSMLQNELGARNELLTPQRLKSKFPWINTEGLALGCHGLEKEGWFDPWALLMGFKHKAREFGAHFIQGEVSGFEFKNNRDVVIGSDEQAVTSNMLAGVDVKLPNGETRKIKFACCVLAAGAESGAVARLAGIGKTDQGLLSIPLPVEPRKRYVYVFNTQGENAPGIGAPLTIDPNGTYFRRDGLGGNYLCGRSPESDNEPNCSDLEVDHSFFENEVWPSLANRVPAFESAKVCGSWAGYYEYNLFDENGIIGAHPYLYNMFIATGFSGHGIQQSPAVGRAISEIILDGQFRTIDLSRLGFDRLIVNQPMLETNIV